MESGCQFRYDTAITGMFCFLRDLFMIEDFFGGYFGNGYGAVIAAGFYA
jgi:hypothetical protein